MNVLVYFRIYIHMYMCIIKFFSSGLRGGSARARGGVGGSGPTKKNPKVVREPPGTTGDQLGAPMHPKNAENR